MKPQIKWHLLASSIVLFPVGVLVTQTGLERMLDGDALVATLLLTWGLVTNLVSGMFLGSFIESVAKRDKNR